MSDFWKSVLAGQLRHFMTVIAGVLVSHGAIATDQASSFAQIGTGLAVWVIGAGWSWYQKQASQSKT